MHKNDFKSVLFRKISRTTREDFQKVFVVLEKDYDTIVEQHLFEVMFVGENKFDFVQGCLCGTVARVNNEPVLMDLAFREIHLF
jgi:uncharacterized protein YkvS